MDCRVSFLLCGFLISDRFPVTTFCGLLIIYGRVEVVVENRK